MSGKPLEPGWAEALGQAGAMRAPDFIERQRGARKVPRVSAVKFFESALNGSRNGGSNTTRKLERVLGKVEDE